MQYSLAHVMNTGVRVTLHSTKADAYLKAKEIIEEYKELGVYNVPQNYTPEECVNYWFDISGEEEYFVVTEHNTNL